MTRAERLAAGWKEFYGVWSPSHGWLTCNRLGEQWSRVDGALADRPKIQVKDWQAALTCAGGVALHIRARPRIFWRRKKSKMVAPTFAVGEMVLAKVKVLESVDSDGECLVAFSRSPAGSSRPWTQFIAESSLRKLPVTP